MILASFSPLIGQPQAIELLTQAVQKNRVAPAYLFAGPDGVGRSVAAIGFIELLFSPVLDGVEGSLHRHRSNPSTSETLQSRILQRNHPDLLWVEPTYLHQGKRLSVKEAEEAGVKRKAPPQIRLEQVREIALFLSRAPLEAPRSIVVIEQAETMAEAAANGLLKTLEEPGQATLILIAPGIDSLLPTLVSRCQRIPFYRLNAEAMDQVLSQGSHPDILQHPEVLALAQGCPGAAIDHWQQLTTLPEDLLSRLSRPPSTLRESLELAKQIDKQLDSEQQIWLADFLQHRYWHHHQPEILRSKPRLKILEKAKEFLRNYAQPRLVWEVTLMQLASLD